MIVLLPSSEGKSSPTGANFDLDRISPFNRELRAAREQVLAELIETSARPDALEVLGVGPRAASAVGANTKLRTAATGPAYTVYSGVLYEAGNLAQAAANVGPQSQVGLYVQSALFGIVDLFSAIPAYRLSINTKLPTLGSLGSFWRDHLANLMNAQIGSQTVIDCRSAAYAKVWPGPDHNLFSVGVRALRDGREKVISHMAKKYRGLLATALLEEGKDLTIDEVLELSRTLPEIRDARLEELPRATALTLLVK